MSSVREKERAVGVEEPALATAEEPAATPVPVVVQRAGVPAALLWLTVVLGAAVGAAATWLLLR
jgi:hypothetical protein